MSNSTVPNEELIDGSSLVTALGHFLHEYETSRRSARSLPLLYARAQATADADDDVPQPQLYINVTLPLGMRWSDEPPWLPQEGIYCFPSGNFRPLRQLGWAMKMTGSHLRRGEVRNDRTQTYLCRQCNSAMSAAIGPLVTTLIVYAPADTSKSTHDCTSLQRK